MRLFVAAGFVALVATIGACAALSGLADYHDCTDTTDTCFDAATGRVDSAAPGSAPPPGHEASPLDDDAPVEVRPPDSGEAGDPGNPVDANFNDVAVPPVVDAAYEGGADATAADAGIGGGPTCGPRGATAQCNANQVCCADLSAETNACASTCPSISTIGCMTPADCPQSAPLCCGYAVLAPDSNNDPSPKCAVQQFYSSCAAICLDNSPASGCVYAGGTIRLCGHDTDCALDTSNPGGFGAANQCWNFNNAPESWCTSAAIGAVGGGVHEP